MGTQQALNRHSIGADIPKHLKLYRSASSKTLTEKNQRNMDQSDSTENLHEDDVTLEVCARFPLECHLGLRAGRAVSDSILRKGKLYIKTGTKQEGYIDNTYVQFERLQNNI